MVPYPRKARRETGAEWTRNCAGLYSIPCFVVVDDVGRGGLLLVVDFAVMLVEEGAVESPNTFSNKPSSEVLLFFTIGGGDECFESGLGPDNVRRCMGGFPPPLVFLSSTITLLLLPSSTTITAK